MAKKRPDQPAAPRPGVLNGRMLRAPCDDDARDRWPNLLECLYPVYDGDKCLRTAGSFRITLEGSYYVLTLSCPAEGVECRVRVSTLIDPLDALEHVLRSGLAAWVPDYAHRPKLDRRG